ncbi:MAG: hypothetical protein WCQ95_11645 [Bacteroidota bacterium]
MVTRKPLAALGNQASQTWIAAMACNLSAGILVGSITYKLQLADLPYG